MIPTRTITAKWTESKIYYIFRLVSDTLETKLHLVIMQLLRQVPVKSPYFLMFNRKIRTFTSSTPYRTELKNIPREFKVGKDCN